MIRNNLLPHNDDMAAIESFTLTLLDLITRSRIVIPARSHRCVHPQCFDLRSFIEVNDRTPKWTCPVCNKPILLKDVRIDSFFLELLDAYPAPVEDVTFTREGIDSFKKLIQRAVILEGSYHEQVPGFECVAQTPEVGESDLAAIGALSAKRRDMGNSNKPSATSRPVVATTIIDDIDSPDK